MIGKFILSVIIVFVVFTGLDYVIHVVLLEETYKETAELWRGPEEMKMSLMQGLGFVYSFLFVGLYAAVARPKTAGMGLKYGFLFGLTAGLSMGFGSFCVMPIPVFLAVVWFAGAVVEMTVAGLIMGAILKPAKAKAGDPAPA